MRPAVNGATTPRDFHLRWPTLKLPLRPDTAVAAMVEAQLPSASSGTTLLLGVTPELARLDRTIVAVDWSEDMIATAWPGDTDQRRVVVGDWKCLPIADASVVGAMSDGAFTMLDWPQDAPKLMQQLARVLVPGGRAAIRCFASPEPVPDVEAVRDIALSGTVGFHLFKLMFNMAVAREGSRGADSLTVSSATLFKRFEECFPDRNALASASGWSLETIAEIDAYSESRYIHCYPSRRELDGMAACHWPGTTRFVETCGYPGADLCPIWIMHRS